MVRVYVYVASLVACIAVAFSMQGSALGDLASGGAVALLFPVFEAIASSRVFIRQRWYSIRYASRDVRISAAYLFRVKIDDRYLLVRGRRFPQYQPVGGVYKITAEGRAFLTSIGARDDDLVRLDAVSRSDLRIRLKGKKLGVFYDWFDSRQGREESPWREFYEELVSEGPLTSRNFPFVYYNYIRRDVDPIRFSPYADSLEILVADIYELLPNPEQEAELRELVANTPEGLVWLDEGIIRRRGVVPGNNQTINVAEHAQRVV